MGICDAVKLLWHHEPGAGCSERPQYRAGVFKINDEFVHAAGNSIAASSILVRDAYGPALWAPGEATGVGARVVTALRVCGNELRISGWASRPRYAARFLALSHCGAGGGGGVGERDVRKIPTFAVERGA